MFMELLVGNFDLKLMHLGHCMQVEVIGVLFGYFWPLHDHFNHMLFTICWFLCLTCALRICNSFNIMLALN